VSKSTVLDEYLKKNNARIYYVTTCTRLARNTQLRAAFHFEVSSKIREL